MSYFPDPTNSIKNLTVSKPTKKEKKVLSLLVMLGICATITFLIWYFRFHESGHPLLFYPFTFAVLFIVSRIIFEWYNFLGIDVPEKPDLKKNFSVDILTTFCPGEPYKMVESTLLAAKRISYPYKTIYLCDEADDAYLKEFCASHNIVHVTRKDKSNAKAGNINNALKRATGELCVIMDPDHVPVPEFLHRVIPYFEDEKVGYVQCCQGYYNQDESPIARGACEQTYHFYGPQMMGMGSYGTAQAIGANCTFRRVALDSIGGHSAGLTEDMHTSMNLQAKGWKAVYIPEMLSRGLVPADVVAFYKQQLKWSRGSFELLFEKYPFLFRKFNWRQKLHHLMTPLFYLNGFTSLIFLLLPILSLFLSDVPVHIDFMEFMAYFIPVLAFQMVIRQYVQRWLYKPQERGFHLTGGILMVGAWWIYVIGFVYSIIRKKVPYLPTPKEGQTKNFFRLLLPNLVIMAASIASVFYGLAKDWSPFSWVMSGFACLNVLLLLYFCLMCQQRWLVQIENFFKEKELLHGLGSEFKIRTFRYTQLFFFTMRRSAIVLAFLIFSVSFTNTMVKQTDSEERLLQETQTKELDYGGFYTGYSIMGKKEVRAQTTIGRSFKNLLGELFVRIDLNENKTVESYKRLLGSVDTQLIPVVHLTYSDPQSNDPVVLLQKINEGKADKSFGNFIQAMGSQSRPVFLNLIANLHENISNQYDEEGFKSAWKKLAHLIYQRGINNVVIVFEARSHKTLDIFYPGDDYAEWLMVGLNEENQLEDYDYTLKQLSKPVLFSFQIDEGKEKRYLKQISSVPYASGVLLKSKEPDSNEEKIGSYLSSNLPFKNTPEALWLSLGKTPMANAAGSPMIQGNPGNFSMVRNGKPFFVKGIAYNVTHDWRDPEISLTRKALEKDFEKISDLGANTIRRYGACAYDVNILNVAYEKNIAVIYGFWFEAEVNYLKDSKKLLEYEKEVLTNVRNFKNYPAVLGWTIGNETWGLLKYHYGEPYLSSVRAGYIQFLEQLCRKIKAIDPVHPVFTVIEHNESQVIKELNTLRTGAPSLDLIGLNAYYEEQISKLDQVMATHFPEKPYMVTEYGPRGYWHPVYTKFENADMIAEDTDEEKARLYVDQWKNYIEKNKGKLIGGVAYSWADRMEGTATWYGITDFKKRIKPSFYALRNLWAEKPVPELEFESAYIESEEETFFPGRKYIFSAKVSGQGDFSYEWYLKKFNYLDDVLKGIKLIGKGESVEIKIPDEPSEYRLYLHVTDKEGHVVTASKGLKTDYAFMERMIP